MDFTTPTAGEIALGEAWSLRDQVISLTQRVYELERRVKELEAWAFGESKPVSAPDTPAPPES
jgi:hypothetical protein